ncbi:hypothetical protein MLD38_036251 [Melastoma candidum]|uniref:Uncharacterized protein n=1 Tax=Melastoma candidum TaxID=119954 RepID=A0ACB9LJA3_9MYRT|nr:hypothetical protein MLD38_036251 [Melastoma candidum]
MNFIQGAAGAAVCYLAGLFAILILWMYANFWITGTMFVIGGTSLELQFVIFSRSHARLVILMAAIYSIYSVKVRVGWHGVFLSINLSFLSNDVLKYLLQCCDNISEKSQPEEEKDADILTGEEFSGESEFSCLDDEPEKPHPCKATCNQSAPTIDENMKESTSNMSLRQAAHSSGEMKRILNSLDHYDALGLPRHKKIDVVILKREYRKKAMLVHPDKNMGSLLGSESFKKLQCAHEVLSDATKKRDYDEQLRKGESRRACQRSFSHLQKNCDYSAKESRRIQVEVPRAFVCAESKIFDVSEWAICQGRVCTLFENDIDK